MSDLRQGISPKLPPLLMQDASARQLLPGAYPSCHAAHRREERISGYCAGKLSSSGMLNSSLAMYSLIACPLKLTQTGHDILSAEPTALHAMFPDRWHGEPLLLKCRLLSWQEEDVAAITAAARRAPNGAVRTAALAALGALATAFPQLTLQHVLEVPFPQF